jgi:hypothetical protein
MNVWNVGSGLAHPNLVAMRGFCTEPACIVTEYVAAGSLLEYINDQSKPLDWSLRLKIAKDIGIYLFKIIIICILILVYLFCINIIGLFCINI